MLVFVGDTLGCHTIGGFKLSLSRAFQICRTCMATGEDAAISFNSKQFEPRSDRRHREHCESLNGPLKNHYSVAYGVVRRSILLDVKG